MSGKRIPKEMQPIYDAVAGWISAVCAEMLDDEYKDVCLRAAAALCRKRPSPLWRGKLNGWACGIVYAIGQVNFLFDPKQKPYLSAGDLCSLFGVSKSAGSAKGREISKMLRTHPFDPDWSLPSKLNENPFAWMLEVNGFAVDARHLPRPLQEVAFQKGLIPYLPAEKPQE